MRSLFFALIFLVGCSTHDFSSVKKYMLKNYGVQKIRDKEITFLEEDLKILGKHALLSKPPRIKNAQDSYKYFLDVGYNICLENQNGTWKVICDLSRSDVPSKQELEDIRSTFPKDFPKELLSKFWQERL